MRLILLITIFSLLILPVIAGVDAEVLPLNQPDASQAESQPASIEEPAWGLTVIGLLLGGFLFMFLEIAILPGFGAAGIIGLVGIFGGLALAYTKLSTGMAVAATLAAVFGLIFLLVWFFYYFPHTTLGKKFVLEAESSVEDGCIAVQNLKKYVGKEGVTQTMLRPSGIAMVEGERLDVISDCEFIEKGTTVKIVRENGGRLIVAVKETEA
ncbi:MAG: NfeD family protein [Candidatus Riflebacteria bacterium]